MALPFAVGAFGATVLDNVLGRPFELWARTIQARNEPTLRNEAYTANMNTPNVLPSPDALITAWRRGLISDYVLRNTVMLHGVAPPPSAGNFINAPTEMDGDTVSFYRRLWGAIGQLNQSRPDAWSVAELSFRRRLSPDDTTHLTTHLDADWRRYRAIAGARYEAPGWQTLWQLYQRGAIGEAEYQLWMRRIGWTNSEALQLQERNTILPTFEEALISHWRGALTEEEQGNVLRAAGYTDPRLTAAIARAHWQLPGPSDLVRFAVREVWDNDVVRRWGYDEEFTEPFALWMKWYGQHWGQEQVGANGRRYPSVPWPLAYWRAHWNVIAPTQAYRMVHLLRPDQMHRYQQIAPGVTPFTTNDLATVLKVADYPRPVRAWLQAIAFTPLRLADIRQAYTLGTRDREWAVNRLLDRGMVSDDANTAVDLWQRQAENAGRLNVERIEVQTQRALVNEILAGYGDGLMSRADARQRLRAPLRDSDAIDTMLDLVDSRALRDTVREYVRQLRRTYLQGTMTAPEAAARLAAMRLQPEAIQRYLNRWQAQLTAERRALSTAQVSALVANGALTPALAAIRLANLGWTQPDAALLIQQAVGRLARVQASAARQQASTAAQRARQLVAAQRQARSALRTAQRQLRAITPLSALKRWYQLGIRTAVWIRARLLAMGYDIASIDAYLSQWAIEYENVHDGEKPAVSNRERLFKRQTSLATVKRWYQRGVVTAQWAVDRLLAMGYSNESITLFRRDWDASLPRGASGPASPTQAPAK